MKEIKFGEIVFSERIERPIFASDQPIDEYTLVELLTDNNKDSICKIAVRISWSYYDVHAFEYDRFTITLTRFEEAIKDLEKFVEHFSCNRGIVQVIENIEAFTQEKPHLMYVKKLNNMLLTDRDFNSHMVLFKKALEVGNKIDWEIIRE